MKQTIFLSIIYILSLGMGSCKEESPFDETPFERSTKSINELQRTLMEAPYGWLLTYFPNTDSLLFTNPDVHIAQADYVESNYGYGGFSFWLKFEKGDTLKMRSDLNPTALNTEKISKYQVKQNSFTQISFTTFTYLHNLVNEKMNGSSDFLYLGKDNLDRLIFRTYNYAEVAREYFILEKIKHKGGEITMLKNAYANRKVFEDMRNPILKIRQGDRIFFQSNYDLNGTRTAIEKKNRYHLFLFEKTPNPPNRYPLEINGLGGGYVGTDFGLKFLPGIRYNKELIFTDFVKVGNRFVAELVKIYHPFEKKEKFVNKQDYPNGQSTGIIAEIYDNVTSE